MWDTASQMVEPGCHETSQNITNYAHCSLLPIRRRWQSPMMETAHMLVLGHEEMQLVLTGKFPPCWVAFMALGGAAQAAGGEKSSMAFIHL